VPGPVLREGGNEVWVLELEEAPAGGPVLRLRAPDTVGDIPGAPS
jgi:beta-galactosidase